MVNFTKVGLALFLLGFWLFLPIPLQFMGITGYNVADFDSQDLETPADSGLGFFAWLKPIGQALTIYFELLVFNIPNVFPLLRYFVNFMQLSSLVFIMLVLRGTGA